MDEHWDGKCPRGFSLLCGGRILARVLLAVIIVWAASAAWRTWHPVVPVAERTKISFVGEGKAFGRPDIALVTVTVLTEGKKLSDAQQENNRRSASVTAFVKSQEVEEKDVRTTAYNIMPKYSSPRPCVFGVPCADSISEIVGYQVRHMLQVRVRNLDRTGELLSGVVREGANEISGFQFAVEDEEELRAEARAEAITAAKEKAKKVAKELGVSLRRIVDFQESGFYPVPALRAFSAEAMGVGGGTPVEQGEQEVRASVTLTFEIE